MFETASVLGILLMAMCAVAQNNANCANPPNPATTTEQYFNISKASGNIPSGLSCSWTVSAPSGQTLIVYLTIGGAATAGQCVNVKNSDAQTGQDICGVQGRNLFTSTGQSVTVTYPIAGASGEMPNFKVHYQVVNHQSCSNPPPQATEAVQSFSIVQTAGNIASGVHCSWIIVSSQMVRVYLSVNGTTTATQCVNVRNTGAETGQDICGAQNSNTFTSIGQAVTVTYPITGASGSVPNFQVMYQSVNHQSCSNPPPQATETVQSFSIVQTAGNIATDVRCSWLIVSSNTQKIKVYLTVNGATTERQCVNVRNSVTETGQDICGVQNMNTFTSSGQAVTVTYPIASFAGEVPNFQVMYQSAGSRQAASWIVAISSVYILSQILL